MPEGDTIHYAANRIRPVLAGRIPDLIRTPSARHRTPRAGGGPGAGIATWGERLAGRVVGSVDAYGKHLFVRFEGGLTLHSHLRMTGSWGVYEAGAPWRRGRRRAWLVIDSGADVVVQFDGPVLELMRDSRTRFDQQLAGLGQDVLGEEFDELAFVRRLREDDPTRAIGDALLDQRNLAGIGNIWKAESCFAAGLSPWRALAGTTDAEAVAAVGFARERMGQSARDGFEARPRAVYGRRDESCDRCGGKIRSAGQGEQNRNTFWCPGCQR